MVLGHLCACLLSCSSGPLKKDITSHEENIFFVFCCLLYSYLSLSSSAVIISSILSRVFSWIWTCTKHLSCLENVVHFIEFLRGTGREESGLMLAKTMYTFLVCSYLCLENQCERLFLFFMYLFLWICNSSRRNPPVPNSIVK